MEKIASDFILGQMAQRAGGSRQAQPLIVGLQGPQGSGTRFWPCEALRRMQ